MELKISVGEMEQATKAGERRRKAFVQVNFQSLLPQRAYLGEVPEPSFPYLDKWQRG